MLQYLIETPAGQILVTVFSSLVLVDNGGSCFFLLIKHFKDIELDDSGLFMEFGGIILMRSVSLADGDLLQADVLEDWDAEQLPAGFLPQGPLLRLRPENEIFSEKVHLVMPVCCGATTAWRTTLAGWQQVPSLNQGDFMITRLSVVHFSMFCWFPAWFSNLLVSVSFVETNTLPTFDFVSSFQWVSQHLYLDRPRPFLWCGSRRRSCANESQRLHQECWSQACCDAYRLLQLCAALEDSRVGWGFFARLPALQQACPVGWPQRWRWDTNLSKRTAATGDPIEVYAISHAVRSADEFAEEFSSGDLVLR